MKRSVVVLAVDLLVAVALSACGDGGTSLAKNMGGSGACDPSVYPCGPYGYTVGSVIDDLQLDVLADDNHNGTIIDDTPKPTKFDTWFADKGVKVLVVTVAAQWCEPCREEQPSLINLYEANRGKGVAIVEAMIQKKDGTPADWSTVTQWAGSYYMAKSCPPDAMGTARASCPIPFPMAVDPTVELGPYYNIAAFPMQMIIRTSDMTIQWQNNGGGPSIQSDMQGQIDAILGS